MAAQLNVGDHVHWKAGRGISYGVVVEACAGGLQYKVQNIKTRSVSQKRATTLVRDSDEDKDTDDEEVSDDGKDEMQIQKGKGIVHEETGQQHEGAPGNEASGSRKRTADEGDDQARKMLAVPRSTEEILLETETELVNTLKLLGRHEQVAKILLERRERLLQSTKTFQQGLVAGRKCFPGGNSAALGSSKSDLVDVIIVQEAWHVLDIAGNFERFLLQHGEALESFKSRIMQCCEHPVDLPAYRAFGDFLTDLARRISELLGGANLAASPSFLIPPDSFLQRSLTSDGDLIPDLIWSPAPGVDKDTVERDRLIQAKLKSFKAAIQERTKKFKQALGQLLKVGSLLYGRLYEKYDFAAEFEVPGIATDGVHVVVSFTTHSFDHKPKRYQTPILELVRSTDLSEVSHEQVEDFTRVENEHARLHDVYAEGAGFREVVFAIFRVLEAEAMKAASQEEDPTWHEGEVLQVEAVDCFQIGNHLCHVLHSLGWWKKQMKEIGCPSDAHFQVTVKGVIIATLLSTVLHVEIGNQDWYLKLGPPSRHRHVALSFGADWETWFQVEREIYFRDKLCPLKSACAFPVAVLGSSRLALLMEYAGKSLDQLHISCQQVTVMSKQLYEVVQHASYHNVCHGDITPRNICYKNGVFSLIDWGLASGSGYFLFASMVDKAFPIAGGLSVDSKVDLEFSPDIALDYRKLQGNRDLDSLLFCCLKVLNGKLPWTEAAAAGDLRTVVEIRAESKAKMVEDSLYLNQNMIYKPLVDSWVKNLWQPCFQGGDSRCSCCDVECSNLAQ